MCRSLLWTTIVVHDNTYASWLLVAVLCDRCWKMIGYFQEIANHILATCHVQITICIILNYIPTEAAWHVCRESKASYIFYSSSCLSIQWESLWTTCKWSSPTPTDKDAELETLHTTRDDILRLQQINKDVVSTKDNRKRGKETVGELYVQFSLPTFLEF